MKRLTAINETDVKMPLIAISIVTHLDLYFLHERSLNLDIGDWVQSNHRKMIRLAVLLVMT